MAASKFAINVRKWAKTTGQTFEQVAVAVPIEMFSRIVMRSPVDTGRFRGNWQVDKRGPEETFDKEGTITIANMTAAVNAKGVLAASDDSGGNARFGI